MLKGGKRSKKNHLIDFFPRFRAAAGARPMYYIFIDIYSLTSCRCNSICFCRNLLQKLHGHSSDGRDGHEGPWPPNLPLCIKIYTHLEQRNCVNKKLCGRSTDGREGHSHLTEHFNLFLQELNRLNFAVVSGPVVWQHAYVRSSAVVLATVRQCGTSTEGLHGLAIHGEHKETLCNYVYRLVASRHSRTQRTVWP